MLKKKSKEIKFVIGFVAFIIGVFVVGSGDNVDALRFGGVMMGVSALSFLAI